LDWARYLDAEGRHARTISVDWKDRLGARRPDDRLASSDSSKTHLLRTETPTHGAVMQLTGIPEAIIGSSG